MKKFPKIRYPGDSDADGILADNIVVTEKFDGANFRVAFNSPEDFEIGTRNQHYEDPHDENFPKAFIHTREWLKGLPLETRSMLSSAGGTFYGEAMHLHSLNYQDIDWATPSSGPAHVPLDSNYANVYFFDWMRDNGDWADWDDFMDFAISAAIPTNPVLYDGPPEPSAIEVPEESMLGGPPEGIVVRRKDGSVRAKQVTEEFKERNAQSFNEPSSAQTSAGQFVAQFVTDARIKDTAHGLVEGGEYDSLTMPMMADLPLEVLRDVMIEEGLNLMLDEYGFEADFDADFKGEVRSKASKKCARVLKQEINDFKNAAQAVQ